MNPEHPSFDQVRAGLGDKVLGAVSLSVADAKGRLTEYRQVLPDHAAEHSQRGLANMRHRNRRVWSYPTPTFLDFQLQGVQLMFPGMTEARLNVGYSWDEATRTISAPVISLPHGDDVIWYEVLDAVQPAVAPLRPDVDGPELPAIDLIEDDDEEGTEDR